MISICFSGMDGSGKSTQCKKIIKRFQNMGIEVKTVHMLSHGKTLGSKSQSLPLVNVIHKRLRDLTGKGISRWPKLIIGLAYYLGDAWTTHINYKRKYRDNLVIYDRYFFDPLIIFVSKFIKIPWWVLRLSKLLPQCDVVIIMEANPEISKMRKPEESLEILATYRQLYEKLSEILSVKPIDGSRNISIIERDVYNRCLPIFKRFIEKSKKPNLIKSRYYPVQG